jgi:hypothetical protein
LDAGIASGNVLAIATVSSMAVFCFFGIIVISGSCGEVHFVEQLDAELVQELLVQSIAPSTRVKYTAV